MICGRVELCRRAPYWRHNPAYPIRSVTSTAPVGVVAGSDTFRAFISLDKDFLQPLGRPWRSPCPHVANQPKRTRRRCNAHGAGRPAPRQHFFSSGDRETVVSTMTYSGNGAEPSISGRPQAASVLLQDWLQDCLLHTPSHLSHLSPPRDPRSLTSFNHVAWSTRCIQGVLKNSFSSLLHV